MTGRRTARELERAAAGRPAPATVAAATGEAEAMLVRRGLRPRLARPDLPFPRDLDGPEAERLAEKLGHYGFRLFLRGAILARGPFRPADVTRYLTAAQAEAAAEALVALGLGRRDPDGRCRLRWPARSFGGTLEWWVARELRRRLGLDVLAGVRSGARGVGGDLDVVAAGEGKLLYVELKSSPPKHITASEVAAFVDRLRALRPHLSIFAVDTALRLPDKVLPMLAGAVGTAAAPRRLLRDCWAVAPGLYAVNARQDLVENLCVAIADGLLALSPDPP
ncbi:MAG TPA: hypothetical protein VFP50_17900 [Anaeromyxobacteraceae bacterium]|nr:hypothetical protein [Anaeromyxobacteraceae bacterium]